MNNPHTTPRQAAWLRALAKARALGTAPRGQGTGRYLVAGSAGDTYTVRRLDPHGMAFACDCKAGREGRPCYHAAAVAALPAEVALRRVHRARSAGIRLLSNERSA